MKGHIENASKLGVVDGWRSIESRRKVGEKNAMQTCELRVYIPVNTFLPGSMLNA